MAGGVYQLKVTIVGIRPPVWRRLVVAESIPLSGLHEVFQAAFGWLGYHLHEFEIDGVRYGDNEPDGWGDRTEDERKAKLNEVAGPGSSFMYVYDFGDDWRHKVLVEKELPATKGASYPVCTGGRRHGPPEDCGGPWGYADLLEALADPDHEDHEEMLGWAGESFDPEAFDPADFDGNRKTFRLMHG